MERYCHCCQRGAREEAPNKGLGVNSILKGNRTRTRVVGLSALFTGVSAVKRVGSDLHSVETQWRRITLKSQDTNTYSYSAYKYEIQNGT